MMIVYMFIDPNENIDEIETPIFFFGLSNSMINPLIYGAFHLHKTKRRSSFSRHVSQSTFLSASSFRKTHFVGRNDDPSSVTIVEDLDGNFSSRGSAKQHGMVNLIMTNHYQHSNGRDDQQQAKCTAF